MRRKRLIFYAALALAAPMPAFAIGLGSSSPPASLDVHASLDTCGLFENQIVCKIDVGYNEIAGADSYTASVTAPNGSVSDYGSVGAGGTSLWVPYSGDGTYSVTVQAWGDAPKPGKPRELVATDVVSAGHRHGAARTGHAATLAPAVAQPTQQGGAGLSASAPGRDAGAQGNNGGPPSRCDQTPPAQPPTGSSGDGSGSDSGATGPTGPTGAVGANPSSGSADPNTAATTLGGSHAGVATLELQGEVPDSTTSPACPPSSK